MSINVHENVIKAVRYYISKGLTLEGACGLAANQFRESFYQGVGFVSTRLERLCVQRYRENRGITYTDKTYTEQVDNGKISRSEFLSPMGKHYGYGLSQWTTSARKAGLYDLCKKTKVSIGDMDTQIIYTIEELKEKFPTIYKYLCTVKDVTQASNYVLQHYEQPNNWQTMKEARADTAKQIYNKMKEVGTSMGSINNIIARERSYAKIPYKETSVNNQKFSTMVNNAGLKGCQGQPWCATYQFALELEEFGKAIALSHWNMTTGNYCGYSVFETEAKFAKAGKTGKTPKVGALVIFKQSHMGRVLSVNEKNKTFECGEGNTSNREFNRNGDCCAVKTYSWTDAKIKSFCYINYGQSSTSTATKTETTTSTWSGKGTAHCSANGINIRKTPDSSIKTNIVGQLKAGNQFEYNGETQSNFVKIRVMFGGKQQICWIHKNYVVYETGTKAETNSTTKKKTYTVTTDAHARKYAGKEYATLVSYPTLKKGTVVTYLATVKAKDGVDWYRVEIDGKKGKKIGYVSSKCLK